ncbi:response regulator [Sphingobium olei]|uniref:Response regulator n=1 Tax=Sphingobium olei TaxID=420955 RepID=A0ABW3NXI7_9SPHN|nr:response regulator [Sphingobium sp.]
MDRRHILVVEDEYFIAKDVWRALADANAVIVGPTGKVVDALRLIKSERIDAAILDVNLDGTTTFDLAMRLSERGIPYLFLTGYDGWSLPDAFRDIPRINKPFSSDQLIAAVAALFREADETDPV